MASATLTICDETPLGQRSNIRILDFLIERITVRELIRARIYEEVREYNASAGEYFRGLVQPTDTEATLNGYRLREKRHRPISWHTQFNRALEQFQRNGFFILVDNHQVEELDEEITVSPQTVVSFVKLVPLVGG
jgi:hypothetical protein